MMEREGRELPRGWAWSTVGDILRSLESGGRPKGGAKGITKGIPSIGGEHLEYSGTFNFTNLRYVPCDFFERMTKGKIRANDVLVVKDGATTGKTAYVPDSFPFREAAVNEHVFILRVFDGLTEPKYLSFWMQSGFGQQCVKDNFQGTAQGGINTRFVQNSRFAFPPLPEQKRIVAKIEELFTKLDAGVEALKKIKAQLKRYRQAVLKHAFEGKLTEKWRQAHKGQLEPASKLLERIAKEREKTTNGKKQKKLPPLDTSDLPELPDGWEWAQVGLLADILGGYAFKSKEYTDSGFQIVKIGNVKPDGLDLSVKPCFIRPSDEKIVNRYLLQPKDIVITLTGTRRKRDYGFVGTVKNQENLLLNQRVARLRCHTSLVPEYVLLAMRGELFRDFFFANETGNVGQGNVGMAAIANSPIPFPPLKEQAVIVSEIERHFSIADQIEQTIGQGLKQSDRLRQSILKKAFEGKLVPQDPEDEPAEKLLERIKAEIGKLQARHKAKNKTVGKSRRQEKATEQQTLC